MPGLVTVGVIGDASSEPIVSFVERNYLTIGLRDKAGHTVDCRCTHHDDIVSDPIPIGPTPFELMTFSIRDCFGHVSDAQLCIVNWEPKPGPSSLPSIELCAPVPK
ncbi:MAG: hypothetical protein IPJ34_26470 [Myxococcales bacterium]|nr:hypothetical protein [Myxococcales bacterium]